MSISSSIPVIGFANDRTTSTQEFPLGSVVVANGTDYIYAQATAGAIAAAGTTNLTGAFGTAAGTTYSHDVVAPGVAANGYFWAKKVASAL